MRIGVIGLGKVGLPLALVMAAHGNHQVIGWDVDRDGAQARMDRFGDDRLHPEKELRDLLNPQGGARVIPIAPDLKTLVEHCDLFFVIVPTPHPPGYAGTETSQRLPSVDYDCTALQDAIDSLMTELICQPVPKSVVIVSTVSPGTCRSLMAGHPEHITWAYNPVFISLGRVVRDLLDPDYILVGADDGQEVAAQAVVDAWTPVVNTSAIKMMGVGSAELGKMAVNAWISMRIGFANTMAAMSEECGADVDLIMDLIARSSGADSIPDAGLGDGGACRPRDLVTLDYLLYEDSHHRHGFFGDLLQARLDHAEWLAEYIFRVHLDHPSLPVVMVGEAYKPNVPYTDGSPAVLLRNLLSLFQTTAQPPSQLETEPLRVALWDPVTHNDPHPPREACLYILAVPHAQVLRNWGYDIPDGSVVVDINAVLPGCRPTVKFLTPGRLP